MNQAGYNGVCLHKAAIRELHDYHDMMKDDDFKYMPMLNEIEVSFFSERRLADTLTAQYQVESSPFPQRGGTEVDAISEGTWNQEYG